jgi:hypothetical protein
MCVQSFDDSLNSAIRITYRISLRSSSLQEPRYPLLKVVCCLLGNTAVGTSPSAFISYKVIKGFKKQAGVSPLGGGFISSPGTNDQLDRCGNDPSAGSPTETLLRLHLPLNGKV